MSQYVRAKWAKLADEHLAGLSLHNYPQREFTHEFVANSIRSAFMAGQRARAEQYEPCLHGNGPDCSYCSGMTPE